MSLTVLDGLKRGLGAGAIAGLAYGAYLWFVQTPLLETMEGQGGHETGHGEGAHAAEHLLSETAVALGGVAGGLFWGLLLGAAFGVAYYVFEPALPGTQFRPYVLAVAGFVTVSGAPWLVFPPTDPGATAALSADTRVLVYAGAMVVGAVACVLSVAAYNRGLARNGPIAGLVAGAIPIAAVLAAGALAPTLGGTGGGELAIAFRGTVFVGQISLWLVLATAFDRLDGVVGTARRVDRIDPTS